MYLTPNEALILRNIMSTTYLTLTAKSLDGNLTEVLENQWAIDLIQRIRDREQAQKDRAAIADHLWNLENKEENGLHNSILWEDCIVMGNYLYDQGYRNNTDS